MEKQEANEVIFDGGSVFAESCPSVFGEKWKDSGYLFKLSGDNIEVGLELNYDRDREEFPEEISISARHDGGLINIYFTIGEVVERVVTGRFIKTPVDGEAIRFTFGDFAILNEDCQGTEDKPWLTTRTTVTLPYEIERRRDGT